MQYSTVVTNGCFDILHIGHIRLLKYCKSLADDVIVLLNSDTSVKLLNKGIDRPINPQYERYEILMSLKYVSQVIIFDEKTPCKLIDDIKPQFYVKGGDYIIDQIPETSIVKKYGGEVKLFLHTGHSTTKIINKINDN
tara:strand:+ start:12902 stop:13315 length:414 start_codon:yes stop_codon:yes gene_type:complete